MIADNLTAADLTTAVAEQFLAQRRAAGIHIGVTSRAIAPMLGYLRGLQVIPPHSAAAAVTPQQILLAEYRRYLEDERGVSPGTAVHYLRCARTFLTAQHYSVGTSLADLPARNVTAHVLERTVSRRGKAQDMVTLPALRSLLRFLHVAGHTVRLLTAAVPAGRGRPRGGGVPQAASSEHVRAILASCDRDSAGGCRDYTVLLTMARLAFRGGEVARLQLGDIGWRAGELTVRGKGARTDVLPLPADVGQAMADHLLRARPKTMSRNLFVALVAPSTGLATSSITQIGWRACQRAGSQGSGRTGYAIGWLVTFWLPGVDGGDRSAVAPCSAAHHSYLRQARSGSPGRTGHACPQGTPR